MPLPDHLSATVAKASPQTRSTASLCILKHLAVRHTWQTSSCHDANCHSAVERAPVHTGSALLSVQCSALTSCARKRSSDDQFHADINLFQHFHNRRIQSQRHSDSTLSRLPDPLRGPYPEPFLIGFRHKLIASIFIAEDADPSLTTGI